mmetsp:Transcript_14678/g.14295  ORF Transcript_14678/g.14295 Transcript_14678/m.14295 type:complete len:111 (-) Transcript_14678:1091-1423(-)
MYHSILEKKERYPTHLTRCAKDLLEKLLKKDPNKRLGQDKAFEEVKEHQFCKGIDWNAVYEKKVKAPIEVNFFQSNFDSQYTQMAHGIDLEEEYDHKEKKVAIKKSKSQS